jgi:membrane protease YdiL (CAAX protease family)
MSTGSLTKACKYGIGLGVIPVAVSFIDYSSSAPVGATPSVFANYSFAGKLLVVIHMTLLVPILEELWFRGFIYPSLRDRYGIFWAALISNALFGILHLPGIIMLIIAFVRGLVFTWTYQKSGTVWGAIIAHCINNIPATVFMCMAQ